jgi:Na+/H+ antiporter NhaC
MALLKISPIFVMIILLLNGIDVKVSAFISTIYGAVIAAMVEKFNYNKIVEKIEENVRTIIIVFFILMFAYAIAEAFMATGVGAAIIRLSLQLGLTGKTAALVGFLVTAVLSTATGTSWGTFAACAPIFLWINHIVGGNFALMVASIAGGSCFGDNIGLISDTTVVSCGIQNVEVIHRVRNQGVWSLLCLITAAILIYVTALGMGLPDTVGHAAEAIDKIPSEAWKALEQERPAAVTLLHQVKGGVPSYMVIPMIIVIAVAIMGLPTLICLGLGLLSTLVMGLIAGTITLRSFCDLLYTGFSNAGNYSVSMMLWVAAFGGVMNMMNAFEPLSKAILKISRSVRQLLFCNGLLCLVGNAALADEMAQIVTIGPIIKNMTDENVEASDEDMYKLRLRNAIFSDAMGVYGSQLIPWHCYIVFYLTIASTIYPLYKFTFMDIFKYNYMSIIAVGSILILTLTGLDRLIPLFQMPSEPRVRLKKTQPSKIE